MPSTNEEHILAYLEHLKFVKRYSPHTLKSYEEDLALFRTSLFDAESDSDFPILEASPYQIRSWMAAMADKGQEPRSINRRLSCLKSFYRFLQQLGLIGSSPASAVKLLKTGKRLPSYIEKGDMATLFRDVEFPEGQEGSMHRLALGLLYGCGLRVSELVNLKERHVDIGLCTIKVLGKGNKERIIPIGEELVREITNYRMLKEGMGEVDGLLLTGTGGKAISNRQAYGFVRKYLSLVTTAEKKSPHVLRHSFATHLMNNGADLNAVKELLGHSSLSATQVYTHNSIEKLREVHRKAHPRG